eukprot:gnl/TRDRNA2_/TRDRNA2_139978_c3_seq2.p1 gnl/TRDRNA2_/TRDRNA2_139978_c3~~gnl/TRDRNA2_/TRDRNA2_139978_c3_seq2.p1  ORF type:complete len:425 (+),score=36.38 gnl/TRDRNA2_/TRDRNA2_139978_c3_seq2:126-1277(+)
MDLIDATGVRAASEETSWYSEQAAGNWAACPERKGNITVGERIEVSILLLSLLMPAWRARSPVVRRWRRCPDMTLTGSPSNGMTVDSNLPHGPSLKKLTSYRASRDVANRAMRDELSAIGQAPVLCKLWVANRNSSSGSRCDAKCSYRHYFLDAREEARAAASEFRKKQLRAQAASERAVYERVEDCGNHGPKANKGQRASCFAKWLLKQYGYEELRHGLGVLDVAGGRGDLSWALSVNASVPCTLIDPGRRRKGKLRCRHRQAVDPGDSQAFSHIAVHFCVETFGHSTAQYASLLRNASLVIGLHPDEATEAIVDLALLSDRKFAVVPCCVFPNLFPHRELSPGGVQVRTLNQFCSYLKAKDPRIQEALLDFDGCNKVLYIP